MSPLPLPQKKGSNTGSRKRLSLKTLIVHISLEIALTLGLAGSLAYIVRGRRAARRLKWKNRILEREAKRARRKAEAWQRGWDADKQRFLEALGDVFLLLNAQGRILSANGLAKEFVKNDEPEGLLLEDLFQGNDILLDETRKALETAEPYTHDFILPASFSPQGLKGGETAWHLDVAPVLGAPGYRRVIFRDMTPAYQTDQVRKDFVANASHELRTPLTIIIGYIESLQEEDFLEESPGLARKFLDTMHKHGLRLQRIVEDMLMISKLESGQATVLKEETFDLNDCVLDVFSRLESVAEKKKATLGLRLDGENILLYGDKFYWTQILFNLVENALKQNLQPDLKIEVGSRREGDRFYLWVSDDGIGIPASSLPYIFKRFYRVETHHSQEIKGTGLGLSIVKRAVEAHDGTLEVTSKPGIDTRFTICLPLSRVREGSAQ